MSLSTKTKSQIKQKQSGFTIVELLIVIVVVAILAAVSVVAYGGIRDRALNAQIISHTHAYLKAFAVYKAEHGEFPMETAPNLDDRGAPLPYHNKLYCLMPGSSMPTNISVDCGGFGGDAGLPPGMSVAGGAANVRDSPNRLRAFEELISPYMGGQLPNTYPQRPMAYDGGAISTRRYGAYYTANRPSDGTDVSYMLYGDQQCPNPPVGQIQYQGYNSSRNVTTCLILLAPYKHH